MGNGSFFVGYEYLKRVLNLPDGAIIIGVLGDDMAERLLVGVSSPEIKGEGVILSPVMHSEPVYKVTLESWGEQIGQEEPKG